MDLLGLASGDAVGDSNTSKTLLLSRDGLRRCVCRPLRQVILVLLPLLLLDDGLTACMNFAAAALTRFVGELFESTSNSN